MLFDEPLSNIDNEAKEEYKLLILEAKRILPNSTFVYVTHNINDALQLSNKIMVIDQGDILQYDDKNIVYNYPINKKVCDYLLEYKGIDYGVIKNDVFIGRKDIPLSMNEKLITNSKEYENVTVYSTKNKNYFFDCNGESISVIQDKYFIDLLVDENGFEILNQKIKFKEIRQVLLKKGKCKAILYRDYFMFNKLKKTFEIEGEVIFSNNKMFVMNVDNSLLSFIHDNVYQKGDKVKLYYPYEKIKAIDENGNHIISSYVLSMNELDFRILDSKKGIIKIGNKKITKKK
jgi:ABC-type sugar transport system ATPase subunit